MSQSDQDPTFSVVIPCYNEERYVGKLLADLQNQTVRPVRVIVADCSSEDATLAVARSFIGKLPIRIVEGCGRSPAAARNTGAKALGRLRDQDYLVFIDADMQIPSTFLEQVRAIICKHPVGVITPRFMSDGHSLLDKPAVRGINARNRYIINRQRKVAGIGGIMIVRKSLHDRTGGFPEDVVQDDMGYVARLNAAGATAYYAADVGVVHSSRRWQQDSVFSILRDYVPEDWMVGRFFARLRKRGRQYGHYNKK